MATTVSQHSFLCGLGRERSFAIEHYAIYTYIFPELKILTYNSGTSVALLNIHHSHQFDCHLCVGSLQIFSVLICLILPNRTNLKCFDSSQVTSLVPPCAAPVPSFNKSTSSLSAHLNSDLPVILPCLLCSWLRSSSQTSFYILCC